MPVRHSHAEILRTSPAFEFSSRRSVVYGTKGMVACTQPMAAAAGLDILNAGGNAADAAVAVSAVLNLTEPGSCGIGGDAFCLFFDAKDKSVKGFNGSGKSPAALTLAKARELGIEGKHMPFENINAATVPGCAAAWYDTIEWYGSGKVTLKQALAPAIRLATEGVPISELSSHSWRNNYNKLVASSPNSAEILITDPTTGKTHSPAPGEVFKNPSLAATFTKLAEEGKKGFYEGRIAEAIVELVQSKGGVMTLDDLKAHATLPITPISYSYGGKDGVTLHECPPNGQGITALIALGIVEALEENGTVDLSELQIGSAEWLHILIEAIRVAFADTRALIACPDTMQKETIDRLLSKEYLQERAAIIDPKASNPVIRKSKPIASSDTVLFTVTDSEGNAMSYIQSNYEGFGTCAVPKGCGFTLQNRGAGFTLEEGHPNCLAGAKRPYHTIIPALVTRGDQAGGDLFMTYGVMGGFMQPQGHLQVLLNMVVHGLNPQEALNLPRFCISPDVPLDPAQGDIGSLVYLEEGILESEVEKLRAMGHNVKLVKGHARSGLFGKGQIIHKGAGGSWAAGSDPRGDGHAMPQI